MKTTTLTVILLMFATCLFAQNKLDGNWVRYKDEKIYLYFSIKGSQFTQLVADDDGRGITIEEKNKEMDFVSQFQQNGLNGIYTWTNTCDGCVWTESQMCHFSKLSDDYIYYHWYRIVNNNSGEDCFKSGGQCFEKTESGYLYRMKD